jgi:CheY-like chemotaxis protein
VMGGTISVDSKIGTGSTFAIDLTVVDAPIHALGAEGPSVEEGASHMARGHVLYIEDNPSNIRLVAKMLSRRGGIELTTATDGATGIEVARGKAPDLVLMDMNLPDMHGEELLGLIKEDPDLSKIPVVVISGDATPSLIKSMIARGARGYLTKPFNVGQLNQVLDDNLTDDARQSI